MLDGRDHTMPALRAATAGLRPVDRLIIAYLAATAAVVLLFGSRLQERFLIASAHALAILSIVVIARARPRARVIAFAHDWYPILAVAALYAELSVLTKIFAAAPHDAAIAALEARLFGGQPSQTLRGASPPPLLDEYLHLCYFAYYLVPSSLAIWLYARRELERFSETLTAALAAFLFCAAIFIAYPVAGPYHHFGHPDVSELRGVFPRIAHSVIQRASSVGTAFPSSHTAVAFAVWLSAWRLARPMFWALTFVVPGLAVGTVWGGFHYATDTLAGALIGAAIAVATPSIQRRLR
jgi:membrane-associated phospholipid phosphatase